MYAVQAHAQLIAFVSSLHSPLQIHDRRYGGTEADNFPVDQEEYLVGAGVLARGQQLPEAPEMLPYATIVEAEAALGRNLTFLEVVWFRYSSRMPDYLLYYHSILCIFVVFTLAPLPLALIELGLPASISPFKIQPKVRHPPALFFHCYKEAMRTLILSVGSFQLTCYPVFKFVGIRTGLPLPSFWEAALQLLVYFLVEDYLNYWLHRLLHTKWGYEKIHYIHHQYAAPIGLHALYAYWGDLLFPGIVAFAGPALVPCHVVILWLFGSLLVLASIECHTGYCPHPTT
ncbi:hypothetical protein ZIOFF_033368 [Zingiber officinale]|uniref:aldehyde oxygenase (deformylating) n=1 Tax=Zingiber officinale TaxID=94328 RepID=A0A8J5L6B6_ZINOF|nr:hypothetical protein ZIOFF_033368 [Zingiber officinale]